MSISEIGPVSHRETYRLTVERVAKALRVPYWLISDRPRPRWWERPVWRLRAFLWERQP